MKVGSMEISDYRVSRHKNIDSLSGIKAIAMILLFWLHSTIPDPSVDLGNVSCAILFLTSGFLVGYNNYHVDVPATWKESVKYTSGKIIKFWPAHFLALVLVAIVAIRPLFTFSTMFTALLNLSLLQAWSNNIHVFFSFNGASWFLSALIFCYFLSPLLIKLAKDLKVSGALFIIVFGIRYLIDYLNAAYPQFLGFNIHVSPVVRSLEYFLGMLLVPLFMRFKSLANGKRTFLLFTFLEIAVTTLVIFFLITHLNSYRTYSAILFSLLVFVFSFDRGLLSRFLSLKPFAWFSSIQFEFYIFHQALIVVLGGILSTILPDWRIMNAVLFLIVVFVAVFYKRVFSDILTSWMKKLVNIIFKYLKTDISF